MSTKTIDEMSMKELSEYRERLDQRLSGIEASRGYVG